MCKGDKSTTSQKGTHLCYTAAKMAFLLFLLFLQMSCGSAAGTMNSITAVSGVAKVTPDNGSSNVSTSGSISVSFKSSMDAATINDSTILITGPAGAVSGKVSYDGVAATFTPLAPLLPQTNYATTITTGVKDSTGKALVSSQTWNFTTGTDALSRPVTDLVPATLFGQHMHRAATTTVWPTAPFGTWRLWDAYVAWPNLEPTKGVWQFATLDSYVALAAQHNVEIVLPLGLSPQWASARPTEPSSYGLGNAAEPANMDDWRTYVSTVATRYKGMIHNYELWNEVNLTGFYSGSTDMMVQMSKEAYQIIKSIDPSATIISPSCVADDSRVNWFKDYLSKGGGDYADVIGYHFYVSPNAPEAMVPFINDIKKILADNNLATKPLWNTESGWYIQNQAGTVIGSGSFSKVLTADEASGYVARAYVLNWASGVNRFYWYAWDNYNMGFVEKDGKTVKPSAVAYGQVYNWLNGSRMISCGKNSEGTWVSQLTLAEGHTGWVVWNADRTITMQLPKEWNAKLTTDLAGNASNIPSTQQISIGPSPVLIEN